MKTKSFGVAYIAACCVLKKQSIGSNSGKPSNIYAGMYLLHYELMIDRPSSLRAENWSSHFDFGLFIWRDILLLFELIFESSCGGW